ncbi:MAG: ribonuclease III, partial [Sinobacterium sp.]|nr:ribonuclease III [Sinobacterium sp.]
IALWLNDTLAYSMNSDALFVQALTHRSFSKDHNERLEFLGDAILDLIIGEALYRQLPHVDEGKLSRYRAELVKGESLAKIAKVIDLPSLLRLGTGEDKTGGRQRNSNLAGAFEALIGAIYLDSNIEPCRQVVLYLFESLLLNIEVTANRKDPKTELQELLQSKKLSLPVYKLTQTQGEQHLQQFTVELCVDGCKEVVSAVGASKKQAQQLAAEKMLSILEA